MAHDFVQIPPDSTGKKIRHIKRIDLEVRNLLIDLGGVDKGATVLGVTSGTTAIFVGYAIELAETYVYIYDEVGTFLEGELIKLNGVDAATIDHYVIQYTPSVHIVDPDSPNYSQKIDKQGSSFVRYSEGNLGFDAFGNAQFSQTTQVDNHMFTYGDNPSKFYDKLINSGSVTADIPNSQLVLSTTSASGSQITRTTHQYYPYNPGEGNLIMMSVRFGDNGKEGVVRRWGLFDDEDGVFFEVDGLQKAVVERNSCGGSITETRVQPEDYNGTPLNVPNVSPFLADLSKFNLFWIDYQWLGVGKVRFGLVAPDGTRITIHTFENANNKLTPYMKRGTLPFRMEQYNKTTVASPSEFRLVCASVSRQAQNVLFPGEYLDYNSNEVTVSGSGVTPIISAKPALTFGGLVNRTTVIPTDIEINVDGDPVRMDVIVNGTLVGSTFTSPISPASSTLIDLDATSISGGFRSNSVQFGSGVSHRDLLEDLRNSLKLSADGITQPVFTFAVKTIKATGTAKVSLTVRWKESR